MSWENRSLLINWFRFTCCNTSKEYCCGNCFESLKTHPISRSGFLPAQVNTSMLTSLKHHWIWKSHRCFVLFHLTYDFMHAELFHLEYTRLWRRSCLVYHLHMRLHFSSHSSKKKKEKKSNHISTWFTGETDMRAAIDIINGRKKKKCGLWKCSYVKWTKHNYYLIRGVGVGWVRGKTTTTQVRRQVTFWIAHSIAQVVLSLNCALNCTGSSLSELRTQLRR